MFAEIVGVSLTVHFTFLSFSSSFGSPASFPFLLRLGLGRVYYESSSIEQQNCDYG